MAKKATAPKQPTKSPKKATVAKATDKAKSPPAAIQPVERPAGFKGIEQMIWVDASTLKGHPDNWKTHTKRQLKSLDAEFSTVGFVLPLAYNLNTGRLLDGHGRKETDWVKKHKVVPVVVGRWSEEEESQILLHLDPIGGMFETDSRKFDALMKKHRTSLDELTEELDAHHAQALESVNEALDVFNESIVYGAPASFLPDADLYKPTSEHSQTKVDLNDPNVKEFKVDEVSSDLAGSFTLKTWAETPFDTFKPVDGYGIPALRPDMLGDVPSSLETWIGPETAEAESYLYIYGSAAIEKVRSNDLITSFYTYDEKFESIWNDPRKFTARMLNLKIRGVISVNFSVWLNAPLALSVWQTYRSRWLACYWQAAGLKVIPDIVPPSPKDKTDCAICYATIPKDAPCISIQLQQKGDAKPDIYYAQMRTRIAHMVQVLEPRKLLVYHGPDLPDYVLADIQIPIVYAKAWMWERTEKVLKKREYLNAN